MMDVEILSLGRDDHPFMGQILERNLGLTFGMLQAMHLIPLKLAHRSEDDAPDAASTRVFA